MYIHRHLENKFLKMSSFFKAVLATGAKHFIVTFIVTFWGDLDAGRTFFCHYIGAIGRSNGISSGVFRNII